MLLENGKYGIIKRIALQQLETPETTYNFEVEDYHTYYVGKECILTHNTGDCSIRPTQKGIDNMKHHLNTMDDFYANDGMVLRIENAFKSGQKIYGVDKNFYMHELKEMILMRNGMAYELAHETTLSYYNVSRYALYHLDVIMMESGWWNLDYLKYWGLKG